MKLRRNDIRDADEYNYCDAIQTNWIIWIAISAITLNGGQKTGREWEQKKYGLFL